MALTVTPVFRTAVKDAYMHIYKVDWDASYVTNGLALTAADLGFSDQGTLLTVVAFPKLGYTADYDAANAKLKSYAGGITETANGTNLATIVDMIVVAFGTKPS